MSEEVLGFEPISDEQKRKILLSPRTSCSHKKLLDGLPALNTIQTGGTPSIKRLPDRFGVAAWNVERCLFPEKTGELIKPFDPKIVLLSEVDFGMARTAQQHTTAAIAKVLRMNYLFGVEFYETGLGSAQELKFCSDADNCLGFHGNAILSAVPFKKTHLIRLDDQGHWFVPNSYVQDLEDVRVGGRMALAAVVPAADGDLCVVSTHLESNADVALRHSQFERILDEVDAFAPDLPVLIGGDLNTGNHLQPDFDWRRETLFEMAESREYSWSLSPKGTTTRASLITSHVTRKMKLDWFCSRGLEGKRGQLIEALDPEGTPLSDHECIYASVRVA